MTTDDWLKVDRRYWLMFVLQSANQSDNKLVFIVQTGANKGEVNPRCNKVADIVFVLDSSTSIAKNDYEKQLNFVKYFVQNLNVGLGPHQVRIGVLSFSDRVEVNIHLRDSGQRMIPKISRIQHLTGSTYTWLALRKLMDEMYRPEFGARPNVEKIAIVLTDGNSQRPHLTRSAAKNVHNSNIKVFALAIGEHIRTEEIRKIASYPEETYFRQTASFSELENIKESFLDETCSEISTRRPIPTLPPITVTQAPSCKEPADIVFILDSSTSIARQDFQKQLDFVRYFVRNLNVGLASSEIRIGVLSFSDRVEINFHLKESTSSSRILSKVDQIQQLTGSTYTWMALTELAEKMFTPQNGARSQVTHLAIILTDGNSQNHRKTLAAAYRAHQTNVKVFALAIGEFTNLEEIKGIASMPKEVYFKHTASYDTLKGIMRTIYDRTCTVIDKTTKGAVTYPPRPTKVCSNPADIVFVLDSSTSISAGDFQKQLAFVKYFVRSLSVGQNPNQVRLGVLSFSDRVEINFHLNEARSTPTILSKVDQIQQLTGSTYTWMALTELADSMFSLQNGARSHVAHVAIILTDGNSQSHHKTLAAAARARQTNIQIFALAIGEFTNVEEIRGIASMPKAVYFKQTASYSELETIKESILDRTCKVVNRAPGQPWFPPVTYPPITRAPPTYRTRAPPYYPTRLPPGSCNPSAPLELVYLINNVHFGKKKTEKILQAITQSERRIRRQCISRFRTIFEDCSTFEDSFYGNNRNKGDNSCRVGVFFVGRGMNYKEPILRNITSNLLKNTIRNYAVTIGDVEYSSGIRSYIKRENLMHVPHIEGIRYSLGRFVNKNVCLTDSKPSSVI
ncbi:cartilage matrix protein-like [Argonauta hians]